MESYNNKVRNKPTECVCPIRKLMARSAEDKADFFTKRLPKLFRPFSLQVTAEEEEEITTFLEDSFQKSLPIKPFKTNKINDMITENSRLTKKHLFMISSTKERY